MSNTEVEAYIDSNYDDEVHIKAIAEELARSIGRQAFIDGLIKFDKPVKVAKNWYRYRASLLVAEEAK